MSVVDIAAQIVLHPSLSFVLKLLQSSAGREKTYRALQNFARVWAYLLISRGYKVEAVRWNALKGHLASARKLFSLGKPLEHLQAALRATQTAVSAEQTLTVSRQLAYFGYLTYDAIVWANTVKFITLKPETSARVSKTSNRFWLAGILMSISHSVIKNLRLTKEASAISSSWIEKDVGAEASRELRINAINILRASTRYQLVMDMLDFWLPASALGIVEVNDGALGMLGLATSLMSLRSQWLALTGS